MGEWARVWGLQQLIRAMGAYFVRRNSKDELYRRVLERYIAMATEAGVTQAVYPEGGLTRDGLMREPRFGVLDYMLRGFHTHGERDLVFVPLGLNYDRVLEDRTQLLAGERRRRRTSGLRSARARWLRRQPALAGPAQPLAPLRLRLRQLRHTGIGARLGRGARHRLRPPAARAAPGRSRCAGPPPDGPGRAPDTGAAGALVATVLLQQGERALGELELKSAVAELVRGLEARNARLYLPRGDWDYAIGAGLRMLTQRHLVDEHDGLYRIRAGEAADASLLRQLDLTPAHARRRLGATFHPG